MPNIPDLDKLQREIKDLKSKLRVTKSDRDMISKYTSQVNTDLSLLQQKYDEVKYERDYYMSQLQNTETKINELQEENEKVTNDINKLQCDFNKIQQDLIENKIELRNTNFEYDVLQVDYYNEKEKCKDYHSQLRDVRKKCRNIQDDLDENVRCTTKRMNRFVERIEFLDKDKKSLQDQVKLYEEGLEHLEMLCFICRSGIKSVKCHNCHEDYCKKCYDCVDICSFCRCDLHNMDVSTDEEQDEEQEDENLI